MFKIINIVFLLSFAMVSYAQVDDSELIKAVRKGDLGFLNKNLDKIDVNRFYGKKENKALLHLAVRSGQEKTVSFLLEKGANPDTLCNDRSPLMEAAIHDHLGICRILLDNGANPQFQNSKNNTALFYAASDASLRLNRLLVYRGADVKHKNWKKWMPLDFAVSANNKEAVIDYHKTMIKRKDTYRNEPSYFDGPHAVINDSSNIRVFYLLRDSATNNNLLVDKLFTSDSDAIPFYGLLLDSSDYVFQKENLRHKGTYKNVDKIMAVGDLHGQYDSLRVFLLNQKIIDKGLNWIWGDGHLVFIGDIFDRGDGVTELLWLIYKLEAQAEKAGGKVHFLLGNHEVMNLSNDLRYLAPKYDFFAKYFDINFSQLYANNTVIGKWLRSRNTLVNINGNLFVHAGISPDLYSFKADIDSINYLMNDFFSGKYNYQRSDLINTVLFTYGPYWYRGYFNYAEAEPDITMDTLDMILELYNAKRIIVGHTDVRRIYPMFKGKVIPIDIPFEFKGFRQQCLLIKDEKYYRAFQDGTVEQLILN